MKWLTQILDIRKDERSHTLAMFVYIFLIIATLTIVKSVRQALFLQKFGAADLPYVYLLIAFIAGTIATIYQRVAKNSPVHRLMIWAMVIVISNLVIFRILIDYQWPVLTYVLYVWVAIYGILTTVQFWTFANYLYDPRQAKRLFALLGVGATLGGIAGGYITQFGAAIVGTENLLLASAAFLGLNIFLVAYVWRKQKPRILEAGRAQRYKASAAEKTAGAFKLIWESSYLKLVMAIIALSIVISTVVDNQFGFVVAEHIPDKDAKTSFYGQFFTWLGWASFLMQFFVTSRLIKRFGIGVAMLILPIALFFGSGAFVLVPMLLTGLLVKIADGTFRYTIHKASLELLYLPLSIGVKNKTKAFVDMFTDRFSKGIAALLILLMTAVLGYGYENLSWVLMGLAVVWIVVAVVMKRAYVQAFRDSLMRRKIDEDELIIRPTDAATIAALAESLQSRQPIRQEKTLETIRGVQSPFFVEPLLKLAHTENQHIALLALDRLAEQKDDSIVDGVQDLLDLAPIPIAARAMRIICDNTDDPTERLEEYVNDPRPRVRLAAVVCYVQLGDHQAVEEIGSKTVEALLNDPLTDPVTCRRELAWILQDLPQGEMAQKYIAESLTSDDPEVLKRAIIAAGKNRDRRFVERLIKFLVRRDLRHLARDALGEYGESAVGTLEDYFGDRRTPRIIRQYLPRVFECIPTQRVVAILIGALTDDDDLVRFAALRSLGRVRAKHPKLDYSSALIVDRVREEIQKAYRHRWWSAVTIPSEDTVLLLKTLEEKADKAVDRVFRLLAMSHPPAEVYSAFQALYSPNARIRANALEYLDNTLTITDKRIIIELVEGKPREDRIQRGLKSLNEPVEHWPRVLETQTNYDDDWLAAVAHHTIWATGQVELYHVFEQTAERGGTARPIMTETVRVLRDRMAENS